MQNIVSAAVAPQTPLGINHLVLTVRDIEESHHFYTQVLGFRHVATSRRAGGDGMPPMRFYSGVRDGKFHHHDIALAQAPWDRAPSGLDHIAIEYADGEAFYAQLRFLTQQGFVFGKVIERGMTCSVNFFDPNGYEIELLYELPREKWEGDIEAAVNTKALRSWEAGVAAP